MQYIYENYNLNNLNHQTKATIKFRLSKYDKIISFNYTDFVEQISLRTDVKHIHVSLKDNNLIIGGLDEKEDSSFILNELKNVITNDKEIIIEIDIFGFSFDEMNLFLIQFKILKQSEMNLKMLKF